MEPGKKQDATLKNKISVIMPVYNTALFVAEAINSVLNQSLVDFELILVNDGSTDNSLEIITNISLKEPRIVIISQENGGLSAARNRGIALAKGEYLYFIDSDDLISPDTLLQCYNYACAQNLNVVFFDAASFSEDSTPISTALEYSKKQYLKEGVYEGKQVLRILLRHNIYRASACLYIIKSSFLKELGLKFYPNILHEDELFTPLLFINAQTTGYLPFDFYQRRVREGSIMNQNFSTRNLNSYLTVIKELDISPLRDHTSNDIINTIKRTILNVITYRASTLNLKSRLRLMGIFIKNRYLKYLSIKNATILLFPITIRIKSIFKTQ